MLLGHQCENSAKYTSFENEEKAGQDSFAWSTQLGASLSLDNSESEHLTFWVIYG